MSTLCHLTGMPINEGDRVLVLPVSFKLPTTSSLCYHSENEACLFAMPVRGVMGEYDRVTIERGDLLIDYVNQDLCHDNPIIRGARVALKMDGRMEEHGCHLNEKAMELYYDNPAPQFKTVSALMEALNYGSLHHGEGASRQHYSYLVVNLDFFEIFVANEYAGERAALISHIAGVLNPQKFESGCSRDDVVDYIFCGALRNDLFRNLQEGDASLVIGNVEHLPFMQIESVIRTHLFATLLREQSEKPVDIDLFSLSFVDVVLVNAIYRDLGRSYFPIASRRNGQKQHAFTKLLSVAQEERRRHYSAKFSPEEGYDRTLQLLRQWN